MTLQEDLKMTDTKRYLVFKDTMGDGLETFDSWDGIDICDGEDELKEVILMAADELLGEAGYEMSEWKKYGMEDLIDQIVIVELDSDEKVLERNKFIRKTLEDCNKKQNDEEYQTYLRLKEKFE